MINSNSHNYTLCEINGELLTEDSHNGQYLDNQVSSYPRICVTSESLRRSAVTIGLESSQSAFLEHRETLPQRLKVVWYQHGLTGILAEVSNPEVEEVSPLLKQTCHYLLVALRWMSGMKLSLFPHLKLSNDDVISSFSECNNWRESPIRYLAWHYKADKLAVALRDDTIRVYYSNNNLRPVLKHKLQRNVTVLAWKPLSASILAVGTQTAVLLWNIDPNSLSSRPSSSTVQVLSYSGHSPITSISWSPHGLDQLFVVSALSSAIVVWDVCMKQHQVIQHLTASGGVSRMVFSPDGSKVIAATPSTSFRVFETATWTNERWSKLAGRIQSSCWNPDGTLLFFCLDGDPRIYSLAFEDSQMFDLPRVEGSKHASVVIDLTPEEEEEEQQGGAEEDNKQVSVSHNCIHSIAMNGTGERLAILFSKNDPRRHLVAIYAVTSDPVLNVSFSGYVRGFEDALPTFIAFKPHFDNGALLTVCYSDGNVRYIPMYFQITHFNYTAANVTSPLLGYSRRANQTILDCSQQKWSTSS